MFVAESLTHSARCMLVAAESDSSFSPVSAPRLASTSTSHAADNSELANDRGRARQRSAMEQDDGMGGAAVITDAPQSDATSSPTQMGIKKESSSPSPGKDKMNDAFKSEPHSEPIAAAPATATEAVPDSNLGPLESAPTDTDMGNDVPAAASSMPPNAALPPTVPGAAEEEEEGDSDEDEDAVSAGTPDAKRAAQVVPGSSMDATAISLHDLPLSRAALPILLLSPSHAQAHLSASAASKGSKKNARVSCHQCQSTGN